MLRQGSACITERCGRVSAPRTLKKYRKLGPVLRRESQLAFFGSRRALVSHRLQIRDCAIRIGANLTGDFAASLNLDLAIRNLASNRASCSDEQPSTHDEIAVKAALDIGFLSGTFAVEDATLFDDYVRAVG